MNSSNKIVYALAVVAFAFQFGSCSKEIDIPEYAVPPSGNCTAGTGGEITVILKPQHHGEPILSIPGYPDSAMIKFNSNEYPGDNPALYDLVVVGDEGSDHVEVANLKCGKYFIYMTGWDESIAERVRGGIPVNLPNEPGTRTLIIPITED